MERLIQNSRYPFSTIPHQIFQQKARSFLSRGKAVEEWEAVPYTSLLVDNQ